MAEEKTELEKRLEKMDKAAEALLKLIESPETTDLQKGRLFAQVMAWEKVRPTLIPSNEGGRLEEMSHGVKSKGGSGAGNNGRGTGARRPGKDGRAIRDIIKTLPKFGGGSSAAIAADDRTPDGDSQGAQREGGSLDSDGRRLPAHRGGNGAEHADEPGNSDIV